eukprot:scaffold110710_cov63-Phaeocystis_antarctica.AAC.1
MDAGQPAAWPRLADAPGSLGHCLALRASLRRAGWPKAELPWFAHGGARDEHGVGLRLEAAVAPKLGERVEPGSFRHETRRAAAPCAPRAGITAPRKFRRRGRRQRSARPTFGHFPLDAPCWLGTLELNEQCCSPGSRCSARPRHAWARRWWPPPLQSRSRRSASARTAPSTWAAARARSRPGAQAASCCGCAGCSTMRRWTRCSPRRAARCTSRPTPTRSTARPPTTPRSSRPASRSMPRSRRCSTVKVPRSFLEVPRARRAPGCSRHPGRAPRPLGAQPPPRVLQLAASKAAHFSACDRAPLTALLAPVLEARLLPYLRAQYACPDIVVADALVRRYRPKPKPKPNPYPYPNPNPDQVRRYSPEEPKPKPDPDPYPYTLTLTRCAAIARKSAPRSRPTTTSQRAPPRSCPGPNPGPDPDH